MKGHGELSFEDFVRRLFEMGFSDLPNPRKYFETHPYLRSFEPPVNLRSAIKWLNTGGSSLDDYCITVGEWAADGSSQEWGEHDTVQVEPTASG